MTFTLDRTLTKEQFFKEFGFHPTKSRYTLDEITLRQFAGRYNMRME